MTDLKAAQMSILNHTPTLGRESVQLMDALNRVLATDVTAIEDLPAADVSALDGYALCHESLNRDRPSPGLRIIAEASAGFPCHHRVVPGTAVRIMTGALVPQGADTVIKLEHTLEKDGRVFCAKPATRGQGIRFQGESFKKGEIVLTAGTRLTPLEIGGLAGLRKSWVTVYRKPLVAVLSTGSELADFHDPLSPSRVMSSNLYALSAQVIDANAAAMIQGVIPDRIEDLIQAIEGSEHADVVITSGGTSKGKYDLTRKAFEACGVQIRVSNQKRKKGKPSLFGTRGKKLFFAVPGNPYAAMISFNQLVKPALLKMMGHTGLLNSPARLDSEFSGMDTFSRCQEGPPSSQWAPSVLLGKRSPKRPGHEAKSLSCKATG